MTCPYPGRTRRWTPRTPRRTTRRWTLTTPRRTRTPRRRRTQRRNPSPRRRQPSLEEAQGRRPRGGPTDRGEEAQKDGPSADFIPATEIRLAPSPVTTSERISRVSVITWTKRRPRVATSSSKAAEPAKKSSVFSIPRARRLPGCQQVPGCEKGCAFKKGPKGLGYYIDGPPTPTFKPPAKSFGGGGGQRGGWANKGGGGGAVAGKGEEKAEERAGVDGETQTPRTVFRFTTSVGANPPLTPCS